jgi:rhodanese-related sulfurtransferase
MGLSRRMILALSGLVLVALLGAGGAYWISRGGLTDPAGIIDARTAEQRVRRPGEWRRSGVPASAYAITMHQDMGRFLDELRRARGDDRARPVALICATGGRTSWLGPRLAEADFEVLNVAEGMMGSAHGKGWLASGLPVRPWRGSLSTRPPPIR